MIKITTTPFSIGKQHSVELNDFVPKGGFEVFLKDVCLHLGAEFVKWYQGFESGIGEIIYEKYQMTVFWTDFPEHLSFDCKNKDMAEKIQKEMEGYFCLHEDRWL